jgi:hypothetical protein
MHRHLAALFTLGLACGSVGAAARDTAAAPGEVLVGRWDIDIHTPHGDLPSWLEIRRSGFRTLVGQFVGVVGSARPISRVAFDKGALHFSLPPQWESGVGELTLEGKIRGDGLAGSMTFPDGKRFDWSARRAPSLHRSTPPPAWGKPIRLVDRTRLSGWHATAGSSRWSVAGGVLRNAGSGANLVTERKFTDFKLHVELRLPKGSNSGVYLRGRYEVQIADTFGEPASDSLGAVYGFLAPSVDAAKEPDAWQSLDITLVGRRITVAVNGKTVVCDRESPGITGGALDSNEGAPGPLLLQGDHGPVAFRNITLTPAP